MAGGTVSALPAEVVFSIQTDARLDFFYSLAATGQGPSSRFALLRCSTSKLRAAASGRSRGRSPSNLQATTLKKMAMGLSLIFFLSVLMHHILNKKKKLPQQGELNICN